MALLASKELSIAQVFAESARLWKKNMLGKVQLTGLLLQLWLSVPLFFMSDSDPYAFVWLKPLLLQIGCVLGYTLGGLILYGALYSQVNSVLLEQGNNFAQATLVGVKRLLPLLVAIVIGLLLFLVGSILLIIPGIIVAVVISFYWLAVVIENLGLFAAFTRCWQLVWPYWWHAAAVIFVPNVIYIGLKAVFGFFAVAVYNLQYPNGSEALLILHTTKLVVGALFLPFFTTLLLVQWNDLKLREQNRYGNYVRRFRAGIHHKL